MLHKSFIHFLLFTVVLYNKNYLAPLPNQNPGYATESITRRNCSRDLQPNRPVFNGNCVGLSACGTAAVFVIRRVREQCKIFVFYIHKELVFVALRKRFCRITHTCTEKKQRHKKTVHRRRRCGISVYGVDKASVRGGHRRIRYYKNIVRWTKAA